MTAKVIQGSFLSGQPKLPPSPVRVPPPIQTKTIVLPPSTAFAGRLPGLPTRAFPARPAGPPAPAFAGRAGAVQRQGAGGAFAVEAAALGLAASGGRALPEALRGKMEAALGADFAAVRVHVRPQAERIGAVAFTLGSDIYFAPGRYQPDTVPGQQLLGHELAHVVQQRAGRVRNPLGSGLAVVQDHALEAEADRLGRRAAAHRVAIQAKTGPAATQPSSAPRRGPPPVDSRRLQPAAARRTVPPSGRARDAPAMHAGKAPSRLGIVQRMEEQGLPSEAQNNSPISTLPEEVQELIAGRLGLADLLSLRTVSRYFGDIAERDWVVKTVPGASHAFAHIAWLRSNWLGLGSPGSPRGQDEPPAGPNSGEERRAWSRTSPTGGRSHTVMGGTNRLPFVMRLTLPGSGDTDYRTKGAIKQDIEYRHVDPAFVDKQKHAGLPPDQLVFWRLRKTHKTPLSFNQIPVFTVSGPQYAGGAFDRGDNQIANNVPLALRLIYEFVTTCQAVSPDRPIIIQIKAHSRNAVALSLILKVVANSYKGIDLRTQVVATDPVPGPWHKDEYWFDPGLSANDSTLVYSIRSEHGAFFTPQMILGANRIIISRKDHEAGYPVGFMFRGVRYKGQKLNLLPPGIYLSDTNQKVVFDHKKRPQTPEVVHLCEGVEGVVRWIRALDDKSQTDDEEYKTVDRGENREFIILLAVRAWFSARANALRAIRGGLEATDDKHWQPPATSAP